RNLVQHSTVWKKTESTPPTWQFDHNNFQEYLASKALATKTFETIQEFVSFSPTHNKFVPTWLNTLSFLTGILDAKSPLFAMLLDWMMTIEPGVLVRTEPEKVETARRL